MYYSSFLLLWSLHRYGHPSSSGHRRHFLPFHRRPARLPPGQNPAHRGVPADRCFVISDFIDEHDFAHALAIANRKHDVVALRVYDPRENQLPPVGMMYLRDAETGEQMWVDTSDKKLREAYEKYAFVREKELDAIFKRSGVDVANIRSDEDYVRALITLFKKRA